MMERNEGGHIDCDKFAVKPSLSIGNEGTILFRVSLQVTNVQIHLTPEEAIELGPALAVVGHAMKGEI